MSLSAALLLLPLCLSAPLVAAGADPQADEDRRSGRTPPETNITTGAEEYNRHSKALDSPDVVPAFMRDLYDSIANDQGRHRGPIPYGADMVHSFMEIEPIWADSMQFNVTPFPEEMEGLLEVELRMYVPHAVHRVQIWQVTDAGPDRLLNTSLPSAVNTSLPSAAGRLAVFHVREATAKAGSPLTLQLTEQTPDGQWRPLNVSHRGRHDNKQPLLVLYSRGNFTGRYIEELEEDPATHLHNISHSRQRRQATADGNSSSIFPQCNFTFVYLHFKDDVGWNSVIEPKSFYPNRCVGRCPYLTNTNRIILFYAGFKIAAPPCMATKFEDLPMLVWYNRSVFIGTLKTARVTECSCPCIHL